MGYAKENGYDVILYGRGHKKKTQSNYAVQLVSAAKKAGIEVKIYMRGDPPADRVLSGNDLLQHIVAPEVNWIKEDDQEGFVSQVLKEAENLKRRGHRPLVMQTMNKNQTPMEQVGWVNAAAEIYRQLDDLNIKADYLVITHSQGGTHSGLMVGTKYLREPFKVVGISVMFPKERQIPELLRMSNETARFLGFDFRFEDQEPILYDEYMGGDYTTVNRECLEAIRLVAQTEGIFLDPVYTGKAMAGLMDLIRKGRFSSKETVVFIHTGGTPALFLHANEVAEFL
jgi:1-aminocyclopropane-1-carboxylate deaminase/D-cysteine desulfhydrase-like pyridoxal-dependent ACC family enzyme